MLKKLLNFKHMVLYIFIIALSGCGFSEWYDRLFDEWFRKWVFNP